MSKNIASLVFWGAAGEVTGSNFMLELSGARILIDCGILQGRSANGDVNRAPFPYDPSSIDYLFVTHAHLDHIGRIPQLVSDGFRGKIYSTEMTRAIAPIMLRDLAGLSRRENTSGSVRPFDEMTLSRVMSLWRTLPYHATTPFPRNFDVGVKDAGHILGSAIFEFIVEGRRISFTGDLGSSPSPLLRDTESVHVADYLIIESVYGDRVHDSPEVGRSKLKAAIKEIVASHGTLIIPAFSLEKTQVLLYEFNEMIEGNEIPVIPVFLDSPLAQKITEIYRSAYAEFNDSVKKDISSGDRIFEFPSLSLTESALESKAIDEVPNPKVIIAGSGMSGGGRIVRHESIYLPDPKSLILFVGYQGEGTLGREIADGATSVVIDGERVAVRSRVETTGGFSSHKDMPALLDFVAASASSLKKVFVVHGSLASSMYLCQKIRDNLGVSALVPKKGVRYELR